MKTDDLIGRAHPIARVSRAAIEANLAGMPRELYVDISHDGWGHGAHILREAALDRGMAGVVDADGAHSFSGEVPAELAIVTPLVVCGLLPDTVPAMRVSGTVLSTKELLAGESVSYGYLFTAEVDTRIALVTGGYAQGIVRSLGNKLEATVNGARHRVVGRVAMDVCVVEIGDADVAVGDEVVFLGDATRNEPSILEWTDYTALTAQEVVLTIGLRANRETIA